MAKALYILDPQQGFDHPAVTKIFPKIIKLAKNFDGPILISKFINDLKSNFVTQIDWQRFSNLVDTDLIAGFDDLNAQIFEHTTYSCMGQQVRQYLQQNKISQLYICGVFTDVCVIITAMEAFDAGFKTYVLTDLTATLHGEDVNKASLKSLDFILGNDYLVSSTDL